MVKIGHASIGERGKVSGGKAGDQTGKEICIRDWYKKPWNVMLICTDTKLADKAADYMEAICKNDNYGYDQSQRTTGYESIKKNGVAKGKGEFDCSSLVATCYKLAGVNVSVNCTTSTLRAALLATGKFKAYKDSPHISTSDYAKRGAVYLSEGHHVVMALGSGAKSKAASTGTTYKVTASALNVRKGAGVNYSKVDLLKRGEKVKISKEKDGWGYIGTGWVCLKYVKKV